MLDIFPLADLSTDISRVERYGQLKVSKKNKKRIKVLYCKRI